MELARMAGLYPAGLLCEMVGVGGEMKRGEDLEAFGRMLGIPVVSIAAMVAAS